MRLKKYVAIFLATAMMVTNSSVNLFASETSKQTESNKQNSCEIITEITESDGDEKLINGALNVLELSEGNIENMDIIIDGREVLSITSNAGVKEQSNGYYSASFTISESEKTEAFITGLTLENVEIVQNTIIACYEEGIDFSIDSLDFIDVEKNGNSDSMLCWAATISDMLHYTGWGKKAGFDSNNELLDLYRDNFTDLGGWPINGLAWFFNGVDNGEKKLSSKDSAQVKNYGESGGYLKDYSYDMLVENKSLNGNIYNMAEMLDRLRNGYGVGLDVEWTGTNSAHAISCWGYIVDNNYSENEKEHYKAVIVSDSDDNQMGNDNRENSPNTLVVCYLTPFDEDGHDSWKYQYSGALREVTYLAPYTDNVTKEESPAATKDKFANVDFAINNIMISEDALDTEENVFEQGSSLHITPFVSNKSDKDYDGEFTYSYEVTDSKDNVILSGTKKVTRLKLASFSEKSCSELNLDNLKEGKYTVKVVLNPLNMVEEAYRYNNSFTKVFEIVNSQVDKSNFKIEANIGEFIEGEADATISLKLNKEMQDLDGAEFTLYKSYYDDGKWNYWEEEYSVDYEGGAGNKELAGSDNLTLSTDNIIIRNYGNKVKFKYKVKTKDKTFNIYSDEIALLYSDIRVKNSNIEYWEFLNENERVLDNNKSLKFNIDNISTYASKELIFDIKVEAISCETGETYMLYEQNENVLPYPKSISVVVDRIPDEMPTEGEYDVSANIFMGERCIYEYLGMITYPERKSLIVNSTKDVIDKYDGQITLREAIEYATENDEVVIDNDVCDSEIEMASPINLNKKVTIKGSYFNDERNAEIGCTINSNFSQLFILGETAEVNIQGLIVKNSEADRGAAIYNNGGKITVSNCRFFNSNAKFAGGAIYSDGGEVYIKNSVFDDNTSLYGAAVCIKNKAKCQILNSFIYRNLSSNSVLYNHSGSLDIVNCTILENYERLSSNCAIFSNGNTRLFNSVCVGNMLNDIGGNVSVVASYIGNTDKVVKIDDYTEYGTKKNIVATIGGEMSGPIENDIWFESYKDSLTELPCNTDATENGASIKLIDGEIAFDKNGNSDILTGIKTVFSEEDYLRDITGNDRNSYYGCYASTYIIFPKKIKLSKSKKTLYVGDTFTLTAAISPVSAEQGIKWKTSKKSIATVNSKGKITAKKVGNVTIKAISKYNDVYASCKVTVKPRPESISLSKTKATMKVGSKLTLIASVLPSDTSQSVRWSSSDATIATVNSKGKITAKKTGTVKITAVSKIDEKKKKTCTITIK